MLNFTKLSMKNFFSFGNTPQVVELNNIPLALVLGHNKDASMTDDSHGYRNGVGKSAIIQGIVYGLYGKSIDNNIKIPNLVNKTNAKNCEVIVEFSKDDKHYRIERGRSPTYFHFTEIGGDDDTRGETKNTQEELEQVIGISQTLFEHIVVLNANTEPFLGLGQNKQREIIEELLGITQLTDKANILKDMSKESKRISEQEFFKIETTQKSNLQINETIKDLELKSKNFEVLKNDKILSITNELSNFEGVDFTELKQLATQNEAIVENNMKYINAKNKVDELAIKVQQQANFIKMNKDKLQSELDSLNKLDITEELEKHNEISVIRELSVILRSNQVQLNNINDKIKVHNNTIKSLDTMIEQERTTLESILNDSCPMCKSNLSHTNGHEELKNNSIQKLRDLDENRSNILVLIGELEKSKEDYEIFDLPPEPSTFYSTESDAKLHEHKLVTLQDEINKEVVNVYEKEFLDAQVELSGLELLEVLEGVPTSNDIYIIEMNYNNLLRSLKDEQERSNPYIDQINTLKEKSIKVIDYTEYNRQSKLSEHQDFLSKLLLNKDSFIRKRIIDQNLAFLNARLENYIERCGSAHQVVFMNDLGVDIQLNGQSYDFKQLSRGERTRIVIALDLAFRDTYESLYQGINILMVDELIDQGLDTNGIIGSWKILQDLAVLKNKNVYVVSHRDELIERSDTIIKVVKEDRFSSVEIISSDDL